MDERIQMVRDHYDANAEKEWERLAGNPYEFILTTWMMEKYIRPGQRILDIGGGPGRYAIHFARMGCEVVLVDLSEGNIALAKQKAQEAGVSIQAHVCNCLELDRLALGQYDHVFLMGPLYHLQEEEQRAQAVRMAIQHLKPGANLYASFILAFAGVIYNLQHEGFLEGDMANPHSARLIDNVLRGENYIGPAFTSVCFHHQNQILPFMESFDLEKLHFFGQEGILAPNRLELARRTESEQACWLEVAKRLLEAPELLSFSEHAMYIGRKKAS